MLECPSREPSGVGSVPNGMSVAPSHRGSAVNDLPLQVARFDYVEIHQAYRPHPRRGEYRTRRVSRGRRLQSAQHGPP